MTYKQIPIGISEFSLLEKYIDANEEFCQIVGYDREQLLAMWLKDIIFEEDYPVVSTLYQQLAQDKIPFYELEKRYVRKDGKIIWVEVKRSIVRDRHGKALHTIAAILDVTERKRNEERLREQSENRVRESIAELKTANQGLLEQIAERKQAEELLTSWAHIFEHAEWGIATVLKDTFVMVNPMFAKMHGYGVGELIGHSIYDVLAPESHEDTREQIRIAYEKGHHVYEDIHIRKDGNTFPALVDASVVRDSQGNVLYRGISIRDITAQKQVERALEESRQYLQELSKRLIEVQDDERRAIARELHERVGQNLYALKLNLSVIQNETPQDFTEQSGTRLADSVKIVEETVRLVRDLLNELRPDVIDEAGLQTALLAYIDEYVRRYNIEVVLDIANDPFPRLNPSLEISLLRIAQEALTNIARHAQANQASLSLQLENNIVFLIIEDNGIGIEPSQGDSHHISHGVKIMRERAEAFGGTVKIGSAGGKGTKVEAIIPIVSTI